MAVDIRALIREIPDFPEPGILFRDITPVLSSPEAFAHVVDHFVERCSAQRVDAVVGIDARGFLIAAPVAYRLSVPLAPVRKAGKLPFRTRSVSYELEYGRGVVEMHVDAVSQGQRVAIIDDLLATGGTLAAAAELVEGGGAQVAELGVMVELGDLGGRGLLSRWATHAMLTL